MVKAQRERYPKIVFCDLSKNELDNGFERIYGSPGNQRYFAAFDVSLKYAISASLLLREEFVLDHLF